MNYYYLGPRDENHVIAKVDVDPGLVAEIRALEKELETAYYDRDLDALRTLTSDDFVFTYGTSDSFTRDVWFTRIRKRTAETEAMDAEVRDRAQRQGRDEIALLTGLRVGDETEYVIEQHGDIVISNRRYNIQDPDLTERCLRYTRVFRREPDGWRCLSHRYVHSMD
jgi:ketosteroid isomerase-like protein